MSVAGVDLSTKSIDIALLDDDSNRARWVHLPIRDRRGAFESARNVRPTLAGLLPASTWDDVWLVGVEDGTFRSAQTIRALTRVQGAFLACLPRDLCVVPVGVQEWKREMCGKSSATKHEVAFRAQLELAFAGVNASGWSQDALDAYAVARAVRALNERAVAA